MRAEVADTIHRRHGQQIGALRVQAAFAAAFHLETPDPLGAAPDGPAAGDFPGAGSISTRTPAARSIGAGGGWSSSQGVAGTSAG